MTPDMLAEVREIPQCDIHNLTKGEPGVPAAYDGETKSGPWAFMCSSCFQQHGVGLGLGRGQLLVLKGDPLARQIGTVGTGPDDPAPVSPASPPLHPRYQRDWEFDTPNWPKDWEPVRERHDLTDRRFLTPEHQAAMDVGELDVPERTQSEHTAVLVSVPDHFGCPVAWIDQGVAGIVRDAARLGAPTLESCENAGGQEGHYGWTPDMAMLWFKGRRELHRFAEIADGIAADGWEWYQPKRFHIRGLRMYAVGIPAHDLPRVAAALREMEP